MRSGTSVRLGGWRFARAGAETSSGQLLQILWSSHTAFADRTHSIDTGIPGYNGQKHMGCYPYWNGQDLWGVKNNAAVNAIFFGGSGDERRLHVPSLALTMKRV